MTEFAEKMVNLTSQDGDIFSVPLKQAKMSELVKTMLGDDDDDGTPEIPLPNVKSSILHKVVEFTKHNLEEPMNEIEKVEINIILYLKYFLLQLFNPYSANEY